MGILLTGAGIEPFVAGAADEFAVTDGGEPVTDGGEPVTDTPQE